MIRAHTIPSVLLLSALLLPGTVVAGPGPTTEFEYPVQLLPGDSVDPAVPTPESILGFPVGERAAFPDEVIAVFEALAGASPRAVLVEHGRTHEGRRLVHLAISSAENVTRLEEIRADRGKLADPRGLSQAEVDRLVEETPVAAWLGYSIHGDETSGSDASMLVAYQLLASTSEEVAAWLDGMVVLIDPMQNPDGRARFLGMIQQHRSRSPNVDDQSLLHTGHWPQGRTNHYLFDLNRDWILGVHPESRGRILASRVWAPLLFVDAHEMGSQDTYMFSPDAEPLNLHFAPAFGKWQDRFGEDQAAAFDRRGWPYWNGFPFDNWYPGYGSSWGKLIGGVAILYEQAGFAEDGVRRPEGTVITYREAIHHHATSSLANLETLYENRRAMQEDFVEDRLEVTSPSGPYGERSWAVLPTENRGRLEAFLDRMRLQGIEVHEAIRPFPVESGRDLLGRSVGHREVPAGALVVRSRQPAGRLAATLLSFDQRLAPEILEEERASILRSGEGRMYDATAWNLLMASGLEAWELDRDLPEAAIRLPETPADAAPAAALGRSPVGYAIPNDDDRVVAAAARLLERGLHVRVGLEDSRIDGRDLPQGSLVILNTDHREASAAGTRFGEPREADLAGTIARTAAELGLSAFPLATMQSPGQEMPDLGHDLYPLLRSPRVALVSRRDVNAYDVGSLWHAIDTRLGIRHSVLDAEELSGGGSEPSIDLGRYDVIVLPDREGDWTPEELEPIALWVEAGGTLVATGRSAVQLADAELGLSEVRRLRDVLGDLDPYEVQVHREWQEAGKVLPDLDAVWSHTVGAEGPPAWDPAFERPSLDELEREDAWRRLFMPEGPAMLAVRTDPDHWLAFGLGESLTALFGGADVLVAGEGVEAVARLGVLAEGEGPERVGFSALPPSTAMHVRQSGLLWPEAVQRLANGALVTREELGRGQVILFGFQPTFRGAMVESTRMLLNAVVFGPGLGTEPRIVP